MRVVRVVLALGYPLLVYFALQHFSARFLSIALLAILAARWLTASRSGVIAPLRAAAWPVLALAAALVTAASWNDPVALLLMPAVTSFAMLGAFAASMWREESVVESFARAQLGSLDVAERHYCRRVTMLWCVFFSINGAIALSLAIFGSTWAWTLYTGLLAYVGVGTLFAAEYSYRQWRFRRYLGAPSDVLFRRLFPPRTE